MQFIQIISMLLLLICCLGSVQTSNPSPNVWNFQIARKVIGSFQFNEMGLSIWEDQGVENTTIISRRQFYVTPIAQFIPNETECEFNDLTETYFVSYSIEIWNDRLRAAAIDRLKIMHIDVAREQVQPLPFYQVRVIWDNPQATLKKAFLNSQWNSNLQQKSIQRFKIQVDDEATCAKLNNTLRTKPHFWTDSIALQYTLTAASTATRILSVKIEHFANSQLMTMLQNMDVQSPERYLTSDDAKRLSLEVTQNVIASQVVDGDYVNEPDQLTLTNIVGASLQFANADTSSFVEQTWPSVYWDPVYARPDKIASYLNKVLKIDQGNRTVSKTSQHSNSDTYGATIGYSNWSVGGNVGLMRSGSKTFDELNEWFRQNNYELEIRGEMFIPKKLNLKRMNIGVLNKQGIVYSKSVQMKHVDAPGVMKVTTGTGTVRSNTAENDDVQRMNERLDRLEPRVNQLDATTNLLQNRAGQLERRAGQLENRAGQLENRAGQLENRVGQVEGRAGNLEGQMGNANREIDGVKRASQKLWEYAVRCDWRCPRR